MSILPVLMMKFLRSSTPRAMLQLTGGARLECRLPYAASAAWTGWGGAIQGRRMATRATNTEAPAVSRPTSPSTAEFLSPPSVTFETLGVSQDIVDSLASAGFTRPAQVQAAAIPRALSGKDFILAAETGSGKTLAYLVPLMESLRRRKAQLASDRPTTPHWFQHCAVVFCPNMALCEQVVAAAAALTDAAGAPLTTCQIVSTRQPPGQTAIDIVVSTPAALVNMLLEHGGAYGREWSPEVLSQRVRHLVADEADMLITNPAYWDPLSKFMDLLRAGERAFAARAVASLTGMTVTEFSELKRGYKYAAYQHGVEGMLQEGWTPTGDLQSEVTPDTLAAVPRDIWVGEPHRCRSYWFVAATMPREGGKSVARDLRKRFPDMEWIQGQQLHCSKADVAHDWIPVQSPDDVAATVVRVLQQDRVVTERVGHVLVFCRDTAAATALHGLLEAVGLRALLYHKNVPEKERARVMALMKEEDGWIMVCTDAAARGIDISSAHHVIQADFALNAVDFLHRIGRTARAGRTGKVTSLYSKDRAMLAETIQDAIERGEPVEGAFSRNRSFSKKFEKLGHYVPRGQGASSSAAPDSARRFSSAVVHTDELPSGIEPSEVDRDEPSEADLAWGNWSVDDGVADDALKGNYAPLW